MKEKQDICKEWRINEEEYRELDKEYGMLCEFQSHDLIRRNTGCNHIDDQTDIAQNLRIALMKAGSYFKRQTYIEECLRLCYLYAKDDYSKLILNSLQDLWNNKKRHGANNQIFGPDQEKQLDKLTRKLVSKKERPNKNALLKIDAKFNRYCKAITWNAQKTIGKCYTKNKDMRVGMVSLSEHEHLI